MVEPGEIIVEPEDFETENGGRSCNYRLLKLLMQTGIPSNKEAHRKMAQGVVWFTEYSDDHQEYLTQVWNDCLVPVLGGETLKVGHREYRIWKKTQLAKPRQPSALSKKFERTQLGNNGKYTVVLTEEEMNEARKLIKRGPCV